MQKKKERLEIAGKLYTLGLQVEFERAHLNALVSAGVPYEAEEMLQSAMAFQELEARWRQLEAEYLFLHQQIESESQYREGRSSV